MGNLGPSVCRDGREGRQDGRRYKELNKETRSLPALS